MTVLTAMLDEVAWLYNLRGNECVHETIHVLEETDEYGS